MKFRGQKKRKITPSLSSLVYLSDSHGRLSPFEYTLLFTFTTTQCGGSYCVHLFKKDTDKVSYSMSKTVVPVEGSILPTSQLSTSTQS